VKASGVRIIASNSELTQDGISGAGMDRMPSDPVPDAGVRMAELMSRGYQVSLYRRPLAGLFADRLKTGDHGLATTYSNAGARKCGPVETRLFSCLKEVDACIAQWQNIGRHIVHNIRERITPKVC
jgi:hypothetical protein